MPVRIELSKVAVKAITAPPVGTRKTVYDTKVPKLAIRVTASGARTWYVVVRTMQGMEWHKLGSFPETGPEQARTAAQSLLGQLADGISPADAKRAERAEMTLGDAFEEYMRRHVEANKVKRGDDLRQMWERCLGALPDVPRKKHARERSKHPSGVNWQNRKVGSIAREDVAALHMAIGKATPILANRVVELLSAIYNKLDEWGVAVDNPTRKIAPFKENQRERFLRSDELPRFFAALAADNSDDFREFVLLALLTGARRGNVLGMRWTDIDDQRAVWTIPADQAKAGRTMDLPLVPEAAAILAARRARADAAKVRSAFVFPAPSATGYMTPPKKRWSQLFDRIELTALAARIVDAGGELKWANDGKESMERALVRARALAVKLKVDQTEARMPEVRLHDLRRSLGSWQAILGASLPIIGRSLGHKSPSATAIYSRLSMDPVRESVERATSAMLVAGGLKKAKAKGRK